MDTVGLRPEWEVDDRQVKLSDGCSVDQGCDAGVADSGGDRMLAGAGMAHVFAPSANAVLNSVRPREAGQASGATNAIRELGGVIVLALVVPKTAPAPEVQEDRPTRSAGIADSPASA